MYFRGVDHLKHLTPPDLTEMIHWLGRSRLPASIFKHRFLMTSFTSRTSSCVQLRMMATAALLVGSLVGLPLAQGADKGAIKQSVSRGASYLKSIYGKQRGGRAALCAYAILKADGKPTDPAVVNMIADIAKRCEGASYKPHSGDEIYAAGVDAMILADSDPEKYQPALAKIAAFLVREQRDDGSYSYRGPEDPGDTSVTQYGALGLWAAARAGVEIPPKVWDQLALWHIKAQVSGGGFQYCPGSTIGITRDQPNLSMTGAGAATMTIAALHLYPGQTSIQAKAAPSSTSTTSTAPTDPNDPLGVLSVRKPDPKSPDAASSGPYKVQASFLEIQKHVRGAVGWASKNYTPEYRQDLRMYNYYTLERMGALTEVDELGGRDWFDDCASRLLASQKDDGSWTTSTYDSVNNYAVSTSFAVLFLTRSTAKLLNRIPPEDPLGGGMQVGGRGLPDDLASVKMQDGRVAKEESLGPLDDLLKSLESGAGDDLFNLQTQIVKKIQLGDRSALIGQTDRLIQLLDTPQPDVRRTALWALARSDDLSVARHMVAALEDPDRDVLIEAHNALCWLSRRPNAFDIPPDPIGSLPPDATDEQKEQAVEQWRANARQKWGMWYLNRSSYEEKNTPFAHDLAKKIGLK